MHSGFLQGQYVNLRLGQALTREELDHAVPRTVGGGGGRTAFWAINMSENNKYSGGMETSLCANGLSTEVVSSGISCGVQMVWHAGDQDKMLEAHQSTRGLCVLNHGSPRSMVG